MLAAERGHGVLDLERAAAGVQHHVVAEEHRDDLIADELVDVAVVPAHDVGLALEYLHTISRRHAVCFLVSDFLAADYEKPLRITKQRHDIIPISIVDEREMRLPRLGLIMLQDLETGEFILVDTASASVRQQYQQRRAAAVAQRQQLFRGLGLDAIELRTDEPYIGPLMRFFRQRERRR